MKRQYTLNSSFLDGCEYDEDSQELTITFRNGKIYIYADVPQEVVAEFTDAASPGNYYSTNIKGKYTELPG